VVNALVVYCHPCDDSFAAAVRNRVLDALRGSGATVELLDLYAEGFDPLLGPVEHAEHRYHGVAVPSLQRYAEQLRRCDTLVLVYPTWWGAQPAMLKGWLERVWVNGVASELPPEGGPPRPLLRNIRRIIAVTTHGSSKWINAVEGEAGKRTVTRAMKASCGLRCRTTWLALYAVDRSSARDRQRFLDRVSRRMRRVR